MMQCWDLNLTTTFLWQLKSHGWECSRETHMFCHISYCSQLPCSTFLGHSFLPVVWSFHIQNLICWVVSNFHRLFQNEIVWAIRCRSRNWLPWSSNHTKGISVLDIFKHSQPDGVPPCFFSKSSSNWIILPGIGFENKKILLETNRVTVTTGRLVVSGIWAAGPCAKRATKASGDCGVSSFDRQTYWKHPLFSQQGSRHCLGLDLFSLSYANWKTTKDCNPCHCLSICCVQRTLTSPPHPDNGIGSTMYAHPTIVTVA